MFLASKGHVLYGGRLEDNGLFHCVAWPICVFPYLVFLKQEELRHCLQVQVLPGSVEEGLAGESAQLIPSRKMSVALPLPKAL